MGSNEPPEPGGLQPGVPWHRASSRPPGDGAAEREPPPTPPSAPPATAEPSQPPSAGARFAAGPFLFVAGVSVVGGLIGLLHAEHAGSAASVAVAGAAFVALFFAALALRSVPGLEGLRGTLGVISVVLLVVCFAYAVDLSAIDRLDDHSLRIKLAAAAGLLTFGMVVVAVVVPSAVAMGLAVAGLQAAVVLSLLSVGGVPAKGLLVASLLTSLVALLVAVHLPPTRLHAGARAWMLGVGSVLAAVAAGELASGGSGSGAAAAGVLALGLAMLAWRHAAVVPAIAAVPGLVAVEAYLVAQAVGTSATDEAIGALVAGLLLLAVGAAAGLAMRGRLPRPAGRRFAPEELLLVLAGVAALVALGEGGSTLPFEVGPFGVSGQQHFETFEPLPAPTLPPLPTVPPLPSFVPFSPPG